MNYKHPVTDTDTPISIAITDDHPKVRAAVSAYLTQMGFSIIIEARNAEHLLLQLKQAKVLPNVCLLDYNMPGMKGDELAALLSTQYPTIRLAAMTANMTTDCLLDMLSSGCNTFFIKSSSPLEWKTGIEQLMTKGFFYSEWMQEKILSLLQNKLSSIKYIR